MLKILKKFDIFGHQVTINFNRKGNTHNTAIGGLLSIIIQLMFLFLIIVKSDEIIKRKQINITTGSHKVDYDQTGELSMKYFNFMPFFVV